MKIKRLLISQPEPKSEKSPYFDIMKKHNVKIDFRPFIKVEPVNAKDFRLQKINILDYTAIIFNSRHGIDHFFRLSKELRINIPETMKYVCVSETVALYLQKYIQYRKRKISYSSTGKFKNLVDIFNKLDKEKYLYVTSNIKNDDALSILENSKIDYSQAIMYQTVSCNIRTEVDINDYDMLIFFSPAGITSLFDNYPKYEQKEMRIGCFGANTAQEIRDNKLRLDLEAPTVECPSITMALDQFIKETNKAEKK